MKILTLVFVLGMSAGTVLGDAIPAGPAYNCRIHFDPQSAATEVTKLREEIKKLDLEIAQLRKEAQRWFDAWRKLSESFAHAQAA